MVIGKFLSVLCMELSSSPSQGECRFWLEITRSINSLLLHGCSAVEYNTGLPQAFSVGFPYVNYATQAWRQRKKEIRESVVAVVASFFFFFRGMGVGGRIVIYLLINILHVFTSLLAVETSIVGSVVSDSFACFSSSAFSF